MVKLNCITITTDASYCPETKVGGWAFRIKWTGGEFNNSGKFKKKVISSAYAERMAVCNALYTLEKLELKSKLLVVNTDFKPMVMGQGLKGVKGTPIRYIFNISRRLKKKNVKKIEFRHVKAHSSKNDSRSYANEWCDREAKKHMRNQRIKLNYNSFSNSVITLDNLE